MNYFFTGHTCLSLLFKEFPRLQFFDHPPIHFIEDFVDLILVGKDSPKNHGSTATIGVEFITEIRLVGCLQPVIFFSFEPKERLVFELGYNILESEGVYFIRLPFKKGELEDIIQIQKPINQSHIYEIQNSTCTSYGRLFFLIDHFMNELLNTKNLFAHCRSVSSIKSLSYKYFSNLFDQEFNKVSDLLTKGEIQKIFCICKDLKAKILRQYCCSTFRSLNHGEKYGFINKLILPTRVLFCAYRDKIISKLELQNQFRIKILKSEAHCHIRVWINAVKKITRNNELDQYMIEFANLFITIFNNQSIFTQKLDRVISTIDELSERFYFLKTEIQ